MPQTQVVFYRDDDGGAPAVEALRELRASGQRKAFAKCWVRIERLMEMGHELRRPEAEYLGDDGIYELRASFRRVQYRILYFFGGREIAVLSHLITKEGKVPEGEIARAVSHKKKFETDPAKHTLRMSG